MRCREIVEAEDLVAVPFDSIDPISRQPVVSYRIMRGADEVARIPGRFAKTAREAIARYQGRLARDAERLPLPAARPSPAPSPPRVRPSMFERVDAEGIGSDDDPDEFYYHVTTRPSAVLRVGLVPNRRPSMASGFYRSYSAGKVFFCDRGGVRYWLDRIGEHLAAEQERPPRLAVVRFPKARVSSAEHDALGTRDARQPAAYFSTQAIPPSGSR